MTSSWHPTNIVGCNTLFMPHLPTSGTEVLICATGATQKELRFRVLNVNSYWRTDLQAVIRLSNKSYNHYIIKFPDNSQSFTQRVDLNASRENKDRCPSRIAELVSGATLKNGNQQWHHMHIKGDTPTQSTPNFGYQLQWLDKEERVPIECPQNSDPDMQHGTCVTHVSWCMPGSLTSLFIWSRWRGKRPRHSPRMRNPQFCVSDKRPMWWDRKAACPFVCEPTRGRYNTFSRLSPMQIRTNSEMKKKRK